MVKCPKCGKEVAETYKRCPNCGEKISDGKNNASSLGSSKTIIAIIAIIVVIAVVGVLASGMLSNDNSSTNVAPSDSKVVEPTVNEDTSSDSNSSSGSTEYWASAKTDKFHLPTCEWAEKISDANKIVYTSREDAIADGKVPCSVCNP